MLESYEDLVKKFGEEKMIELYNLSALVAWQQRHRGRFPRFAPIRMNATDIEEFEALLPFWSHDPWLGLSPHLSEPWQRAEALEDIHNACMWIDAGALVQ